MRVISNSSSTDAMEIVEDLDVVLEQLRTKLPDIWQEEMEVYA